MKYGPSDRGTWFGRISICCSWAFDFGLTNGQENGENGSSKNPPTMAAHCSSPHDTTISTQSPFFTPKPQKHRLLGGISCGRIRSTFLLQSLLPSILCRGSCWGGWFRNGVDHLFGCCFRNDGVVPEYGLEKPFWSVQAEKPFSLQPPLITWPSS